LKSQKPIEIDGHLKYRCPKNCGFYHWLSLKEAQTKNFKVVCDCGFVFKPKTILKIKICYSKKPTEINKRLICPEPIVLEDQHKIQKPPPDTQNKCIKLLCGYGFSKTESIELVQKAFEKQQITEPLELIKYIIKNIGELNEQS